MISSVSDVVTVQLSGDNSTSGTPAETESTEESFNNQLVEALREEIEDMGAQTSATVTVKASKAFQPGSTEGDKGQNIVTAKTSARSVSLEAVTCTNCGTADIDPVFMTGEQAAIAGTAVDADTGATKTYSVNAESYVDEATAQELAEMLGGMVVTRRVGEAGGVFSGPVQYHIQVGDYLGDAAEIAKTYGSNPQWLAELRIRTEIAQANGETAPSFADAVTALNNGESVLGITLTTEAA